MKLLILLIHIIATMICPIRPVEESSKGMIPSYDKIPVEILEVPDVLKRDVFEPQIVPYIIPKPVTNNIAN